MNGYQVTVQQETSTEDYVQSPWPVQQVQVITVQTYEATCAVYR